MFPLFLAHKRNVPNVEDHILELLGPRDLVAAKRVNGVWATAVRSHIRSLDHGVLELQMSLRKIMQTSTANSDKYLKT